MSNRTDWPELAAELEAQHGRFSDACRLRIETELHNAFVAGQEAETRDIDSAEQKTAEAIATWLKSLPQDVAYTSVLAMEIRAGRWRTP